MELAKGQNAVLPEVTELVLALDGAGTRVRPDLSALILRGGTPAGDEDFVFYNQPEGADGAVRCTVRDQTSEAVTICPGRLAKDIDRVLVVGSVHEGDFAAVQGLAVTIRDGSGTELARHTLESDGRESAVVLVEVYRREGRWRVRAVSQGYIGGIPDLLGDFGIESKREPEQVLSLRKDQVDKAWRDAGILKARARIGVALDISASMGPLYESGIVERLFEQLIPVAQRLDDDGRIDVWAYGIDVATLPMVDVRNIGVWCAAWMPLLTKGVVPPVDAAEPPAPLRTDLYLANGLPFPANSAVRPRAPRFDGNNELALIHRTVNHYAGDGHALVVVLTDGDFVGDGDRIAFRVRESLDEPVSWMFVDMSPEAVSEIQMVCRDNAENTSWIPAAGLEADDGRVYQVLAQVVARLLTRGNTAPI